MKKYQHLLVNHKIFFIEGNGAGYFSINSHNGDLVLQRSIDYDSFPTPPVFVITIQVTDTGGKQADIPATVTITVTDVNDSTPECAPTLINAEVYEDSSVNDVVSTQIQKLY